jgi:hypothetical protein
MQSGETWESVRFIEESEWLGKGRMVPVLVDETQPLSPVHDFVPISAAPSAAGMIVDKQASDTVACL